MGGFPQSVVRPAGPELGVERVSWVRILLGPHGPSCEVAGVAHRRPVRRTIPLATASALLAAGVPGVVRSSGAAPAGGATVLHGSPAGRLAPGGR